MIHLPPQQSDSYSGFQRQIGRLTRPLLVRSTSPVLRLLAALHVSPNAVSLAQIPLGLLMAIVIGSSRLAFLLLIVLCLVLDGLDGLLARQTGQASAFGALVDQLADQVREVLTVAALAQFGALSALAAGLYGVLYPVSNVALYALNSYNGQASPIFKSVLTFYPFMLLYLLGGPNWLEPAAWLTILAMAHTIFVCMHALNRLMKTQP